MRLGATSHCAAEDQQQLSSPSGGKLNQWVCLKVMRMWTQRFDQRTLGSFALVWKTQGYSELLPSIVEWPHANHSHRKTCLYASQNTVYLLWFSLHTKRFKWRLIISKHAAFIEEWHIFGLKPVLQHYLTGTDKIVLIFIALYSALFGFVLFYFHELSESSTTTIFQLKIRCIYGMSFPYSNIKPENFFLQLFLKSELAFWEEFCLLRYNAVYSVES
jgi:hypothetical protein